MIFKTQIITDLEITSVNDLYKLKPFLEDSTLKINKSQIRDLEVDRRTVDYLHYSILHRQLQFQKIPLEVFLSQREV